MDLTARDIHEKQFHDAWRGYSQEEVDDFLDRIAEVLDRVQRENQTLQTRVKELDQAVSASRNTEEMLKKTLVSAQQAAEEAISTAKAKASELITEAEERARRSIEDATEQVQSAEAEARRKSLEAEREHQRKRSELDANIERLQALENELKGRIKGFLDQQTQALQGLEIVGPPPEIRGPSSSTGPAETQDTAPGTPRSDEGATGAAESAAPADESMPAAGEGSARPSEGGAGREDAAGEQTSGGRTPQANGAQQPAASAAVLVDDASAGRAAAQVVTLPQDVSSNGASEPAHARRGVKGLFWRDEG